MFRGAGGRTAVPKLRRLESQDRESKRQTLELSDAGGAQAQDLRSLELRDVAQKRERIRAALAMVIEFKKGIAAGTSKKDLEKAGVWGSYLKASVLTSLCAARARDSRATAKF